MSRKKRIESDQLTLSSFFIVLIVYFIFKSFIEGETAEMPGMYHDKDYDLAGFAVGAVARHAVLPNVSSIQASDIVIGLPSSGIHSNGFSLVRKIVEDCGYTYSGQCPYTDDHVTLGESLLTPTKIYVYSVLPLMKQGKIKAFAHITGKQPLFQPSFTCSKLTMETPKQCVKTV